jgi:hypothetical protein
LCDEVEALLREAAPIADEPRLRRIQFLCAQICGHDAYITEKANKIRDRASVYLSARKHQRAPQGADGLMHDMRYVWLGAIRERVAIRQRGN